MRVLKQLLVPYTGLICLFSICLYSCSGSNKVAENKQMDPVNNKFEILKAPLTIDVLKVYDKEVIFYPGAFIKTGPQGKVVFSKPINILGQFQVFDEDINLEFKEGTAGVLNPIWFGANGTDSADDTKAYKKVFQLASQMNNAILVEIPVGKYFISQQIIIESGQAEKYPIRVEGISDSNNGTSGSSFIWNGNNGESMFLLRNLTNSIFENLDFTASPGKFLTSNLELRPYINQLKITNCSFSGCAGPESGNVNLNEGNNLQVSEIFFDNCLFRGMKTQSDSTAHAVFGGWANTKDFHFTHCSIGPYAKEALKFTTTDILNVEGCTFIENDIDISCQTCKTYIVGNYSEGSNAFYSATASANFNAATLINNQFTGTPLDGFVIRDGSGTLVLLNNNFGSGNYNNDLNRVRWEENEYSTIYSIGNVYKNSSSTQPAFYNRSNLPFDTKFLESIGDLGGVLGGGRIKLESNRQN